MVFLTNFTKTIVHLHKDMIMNQFYIHGSFNFIKK
jgi:hypothetical protein